MIADAFEALRSPAVWGDLTMRNPRGLWWKRAGVSGLRQIIREIQIRLTPFGVLVCLDEDHRDDVLPRHIIVVHGDDTKLIGLRFRDFLVYVDRVPVATMHDGGVALLGRKIVDAVATAIEFQNKEQE